jgi:tetratricopeptide (TPR) repeat protein
MISPGCSFTFDGLKQTLLAVQNGIEPKLRDVHHLVVNYRTTKDILVFGNSILATAKRVFPESIEFALPETARKDLGLKVVLCDWSLALQNQVIFGDNQAFIYSPSDSDTLRAEANEWLDDHPFILSALDAKGLEFDDVVVAFDLDRKVWDVDRRSEASLRMLRELYVAVTRAQRRVVVLVKKQLPSMHAFFNHLHCDFQNLGASTILQEFDRETTSEKWFERAQKLFQNDQFPIAASCFTKAARQDWSFLAQGHHLFSSGLKEEASPKFRRAVRLFNERCDFERVLDIMLLLLNILPWDDTDDTIFEEALHQLPHYLPRLPQLKYAISRGKWETIQLADFQDSEIAPVLAAYRKEKGLKKLVRSFEDQDRASIEEFLPFIVADYHSEKGDFVSACRIALRSSGYKFANDTTKEWLKQIQLKFKENEVDQMTDTWKRHKKTAMTCLHRKTPALLLLQVFDDPISTAKLFGLECIQQLGKQILRFALDQAKVDRVHLLDFSQKEFKDEVEGSILVPRFEPKLSSVVKWYLVNGYRSFASEFVKGRLKKLSSDDMIRIALDLAERPTWFFDELLCRDILGATIALSFFTNCMAREKRYQFRSDFDEFKERKGDSLPLKFDRILHGKKVSYTALIIAFGPTVTAYMRMHRGEHYDQELRIRVHHFYAELRTCLAERLEAEKKPNQTMSAKQNVQKEAADTNDCDRHQVDSKGFVEVKVMSKKAARKQKQQQQQAKKEAKKVQTATPSTQQKGKINQNKKKGKKKSGRK